MSTEHSDADPTILSMLLVPSRTMANWYAGIGIFGIFLAVLNILGMVHPTYHLSWGGLFTFEAMNSYQNYWIDNSFEMKTLPSNGKCFL